MSIPEYVAPLTDDLFGGPTLPLAPPLSEVVVTSVRLEQVARELADQPRLVFDVETNGLKWFLPETHPIGWALGYLRADGIPRTVYLPVAHQTHERQLTAESVEEALRPIFSDPAKRWVAWHGKFDCHVAGRRGLRPAGRVDDGMIQAHLLDENRSKKLKDVAALRFGVQATALDAAVDRYRALLSRRFRARLEDLPGFAHVPISILGPYACQDACLTLLLAAEMDPQIDAAGLRGLYETEIRLLQHLVDMEEFGLPVDREFVAKLKTDLAEKEAALRMRLFELAGEEFNPDADEDLRRILYEKLGLPVERRTGKTREPSTDKYALQALAKQSPIAEVEIDRRQFAYLLSHYTDGILAFCDEAGICHGSFNQIAAVSGRVGCSDPNLHNIPVRTPEGRRIREAFVVRGPGWIRCMFDYSQIELRILAWFSRDPVLTDAFARGEDVHRATAAGLFKVRPEDVTKDQRFRGKTANFALRYGMAAKKFSLTSGYTEAECQQMIDDFWRHYRVTRHFIDDFIRRVRSDGCQFRNPFGRIRRVPDLVSRNGYVRGEAERSAIASLVSGTAADLMKHAMVSCCEYLKEVGGGGIVTTIHDDLQFDLRRETGVAARILEIKRRMEDFQQFAPIPIVVDSLWSETNWTQTKELKL